MIMLRKDLNKYFDTYHRDSFKEFEVPECGYLAQFNMRDKEQNIVAVFDADPGESFEDVLSNDFNYVTEYMVKVKTLCFISPETKFPVLWYNTSVHNSDNDQLYVRDMFVNTEQIVSVVCVAIFGN